LVANTTVSRLHLIPEALRIVQSQLANTGNLPLAGKDVNTLKAYLKGIVKVLENAASSDRDSQS
jgi:hypothetical protein